jgi:hypothetical protein
MTYRSRKSTTSNVVHLSTRQRLQCEGTTPVRTSTNLSLKPSTPRDAVTPLADAEAQLVQALEKFEEIGINLDPQTNRNRTYKLLSDEQGKAAKSAAITARKAAQALVQAASGYLRSTFTRHGAAYLFGRIKKVTIIWVLMRDVIRIVAQSDDPGEVAQLVLLSQYLAKGSHPPDGDRSDPEDHGEIAGPFSLAQRRRA